MFASRTVVASALAAFAAVPLLGGAPLAHGQAADQGFVITEVLVASGEGAQEAAFEWVELQNRSGETQSLRGWVLQDNQTTDVLPSVDVPAGAFVVLVTTAASAARVGREAPPDAVIVVIADGRIGNGLANTGDRLILRDPGGVAVDGLSWGRDRSISVLISPSQGSTLSRDGGGGEFRVGEPSPGAASPPRPLQSAEPPPLRITEIFANAGQGQRDAAFEWIEIYNPTTETVDLAGWQVADNAGSDLLPSGTIPPGGYIVVVATPEAAPHAPTTVIVSDGRIGNGLANTGDSVSLLGPGGALVDRVDYASSPVPLPEAGRSIALTPGGWVLNTAPSPGTAGVMPLLATLAQARDDPERSQPAVGEAEDGGGVPAWAVVLIAVGIPVSMISAGWLWRRRIMIYAQLSRLSAWRRTGSAATGVGSGGCGVPPQGGGVDPRGPGDREPPGGA